MHIVSASDLHITDKSPENRKDNYYSAVLGKFFQILKITKNTKYGILLIAGDFFDSPTVPYDVTREIIRMILQFPTIKIFVVAGQHDQRWHRTGLNNTPLGLISECYNVHLLTKDSSVIKLKGISVVGAGWNEEPAQQADIIITHQMVIKNDKLFHDQTGHTKGIALLKKHPWAKCIISGDNHLPFKVKYKDRILINCGSMVRKSKDQINHEPKVWIIDVKKWTAKVKKLDILDSEEAFDFDKIAIEKIKENIKQDAEAEIDKFISSLPSSIKQQINPKTVLKHVIQKAKPHKRVRGLINQIMEEVS